MSDDRIFYRPADHIVSLTLMGLRSRGKIGERKMRIPTLFAFLFLCCAAVRVHSQTLAHPERVAPADYDSAYELGRDSLVQIPIPQGRLLEFRMERSRVYPGFVHRWWLYVPAQYDGTRPAALMVFLDGQRFFNTQGDFRVPVVLDNLIARRELPVMAAVFVDPGQGQADSNRSVEYDSLNGDFSSFLIDEILPEISRYMAITRNPEGRGIAGYSSGGIGAFTVAWHRPDQFRKVFSGNGSFVNIRGGGAYPSLVREASPRPIRVFLQDGVRDQLGGQFQGLDWPAGNRAMDSALRDRGYDVRFVLGEGTHSSRHAGSVFPDAMRWLWRDYPR